MRKRLISVLLVFSIYVLFGCSGSPFGRALAPSGTPASTDTRTPTLLPTATPSPASTLTPTFESTPTERPAGSCRAQDGTWTSKENDFFGPILTFRVDKCRIASIKIWVYVVDGELYTLDTQPELPIAENAFEYSEGSGAGKLILSGVFESAGKSKGTLTFTKGFDIFGTVLSADVVISWTAKLL
jgi:hypothetical protein